MTIASQSRLAISSEYGQHVIMGPRRGRR